MYILLIFQAYFVILINIEFNPLY